MTGPATRRTTASAVPDNQCVSENPLSKILRLTGVPVGDLRLAGSLRRQAPPAKQKPARSDTEQAAGGQLQAGSAYRCAWGSVSIGDVVEFGPELWKVIPASSYPNHPSSPGGSASLSATLNAGAGSSGGSGGKPASGMSKADHVPTHTAYLQDVKHPAQYDELTLPVSYVVHIVPVAPS